MIRKNTIYISDENLFYTKAVIEAVVDGREGISMPAEQMIDNVLREAYTTKFPHLVLAWEEFQKAKGEASKNYKQIEKNAAKQCTPI